jgi:hypothetical protein
VLARLPVSIARKIALRRRTLENGVSRHCSFERFRPAVADHRAAATNILVEITELPPVYALERSETRSRFSLHSSDLLLDSVNRIKWLNSRLGTTLPTARAEAA